MLFRSGIRVAGTGVAAHFYGPEAAEGFSHTFSGWIIFIAAGIMLFILHKAIVLVVPDRQRTPEPEAPQDSTTDAAGLSADTAKEDRRSGQE